MTTVSEQSVRNALAEVVDPGSGTALSALATVSGLVVKDGNIGFSLEVDPAKGPGLEGLRKAAEAAVLALPSLNAADRSLVGRWGERLCYEHLAQQQADLEEKKRMVDQAGMAAQAY